MAAPASSKQVIDSVGTATLTNEVNRMELTKDSKVSAETLDIIQLADQQKTAFPPSKRVRTDEAEAGPSNDQGIKYPTATICQKQWPA